LKILGEWKKNPKLDYRIVLATDPKSVAAEQYRVLRSKLEILRRERPFKTIAVTSAVPGEGKTMTVANLAVATARVKGTRVVLVDADLRRPALHRMLGQPNDRGLSQVLEGKAKPEEVTRLLGPFPDGQSGALFFIPSGESQPNESEKLGSGEMATLISELSSRFDLVLFDVPPILPLSDPLVMSQKVDGLLMVVRAASTPRDIVAMALEGIPREKVLGTVLNGIDERCSAHYASLYKSYRKSYGS